MSYNQGMKLIFKYVNRVLPEVDKQLKHWVECGGRIEDDILRSQAVEGISSNKSLCQGINIFALYPNADMEKTIKFIVCLQTISSYLDNLCKTTGAGYEAALRQLYLSMSDSVIPDGALNDYYMYYPYKNDCSYLKSLVEECRRQISSLPSYDKVSAYINKYTRLYSNLQIYKHLSKELREEKLVPWARQYSLCYPEITCWEFSAAAGSALGIFALFAAASDPRLSSNEVKAIDAAYFPWICGLHILLGCHIDTIEYIGHDDLNFTCYYKNLKNCEERLGFFIRRSLKCCTALQYPEFHTAAVRGLVSMYLSHPKANWGLNGIARGNLLKSSESRMIMYYNACRLLRFARGLGQSPYSDSPIVY